MSRQTKKWLLSFVNECQVLVGSISLNRSSRDLEQLKAQLSNLPAPSNTFEGVIGRCVLLEILMRRGQAKSRPGKQRQRTAEKPPVIEFVLAPLRLQQAATDPSYGAEPFLHAASDTTRTTHAVDGAGLAMKAKRFIDDHYQETATDARVAHALGVSRLALERAFKRAYGYSVHDYLSNVRFARARHLLRSSDLKVAAIAIEVGYKSHKDLYRLIKARTGLTPSRLRRCEQRRAAGRPDEECSTGG